MAMKGAGRLSNRLKELFKQRNITYKDVADQADLHYEHVRKVVNGYALLSKTQLPVFARILKVDESELKMLSDADRISRKYGDGLVVFGKVKGDINRLAPDWERLNAEQKDQLVNLAHIMSVQNGRRVGAENLPTVRAKRKRR